MMWFSLLNVVCRAAHQSGSHADVCDLLVRGSEETSQVNFYYLDVKLENISFNTKYLILKMIKSETSEYRLLWPGGLYWYPHKSHLKIHNF